MAPPGSKGARSWKGQARQSTSSQIALGRWLFTLTAVALVAWMTYLLLPSGPMQQTFIRTIHITETDRMLVPALLFPREDQEDLETKLKAEMLSDRNRNGRYPVGQNLVGMEAFADLVAGIEASRKSNDCVIAVVAAHGVTDAEGRPALICSDYKLRHSDGTEPGLYPVEKLLDVFARSPAATRLLVLDAGQGGIDIRAGWVANGFPTALADLMKSRNGGKPESLFVMTSSGSFQVARPDFYHQRSVFGRSFALGLAGEADDNLLSGNHDENVSLRELYDFVYADCGAWFPTEGGRSQTPLLYQSGVGLLTDPDLKRTNEIVLLSKYKTFAPRVGIQSPREKAKEEATKAATKTAAISPSTDTELVTHRSRRLPLLAQAGLLSPGRSAATLMQAENSKAAPANEAEKAASTKADPAAAKSDSGAKAESKADPKADPKAAKADPKAENSAKSDSKAKGESKEKEGVQAVETQEAIVESARVEVSAKTRAAWAALDRAWALRDRLEFRDAVGMPVAGPLHLSPIQFAPHLWRELNRMLLDHERRARGGSAYNPERIAADVDILCEDLELLSAAIRDRTPVEGRTRNERMRSLIEAWNQYLQNLPALDQPHPTLVAARDGLLTYSQTLYLLRDLVIWHDDRSFSSNSLDRSMTHDIEDLVTAVDRFQRQCWPDSTAADALPETATIQEQQKNLISVRNDLLRKLLNETEIAAKDWQSPPNQLIVQFVLDSPFGSAEQRKSWRDILANPEKSKSDYKASADPKTVATSRDQAELLLKRLILHERLLKLTGENTFPDLAKSLADAEKQLQQSADAAETWTAIRTAGRDLSRAYASLPARVSNANTDTGSAWLNAFQLVLLIDPRDAQDVKTGPATLFRMPYLPPPEKERWTLSATPELALDRREWQPVLIEARGQGEVHGDEPTVTMKLKFDETWLEVQRVEQNRTSRLADGAVLEFPRTTERRLALNLQIRARKFRRGTSDAVQQALAVTGPGKGNPGEPSAPPEGKVLCRIPTETQIELALRTANPEEDLLVSRPDAEVIRVQLYPNRDQSCQLMLVNYSLEKRDVQVELLAADRPPDADYSPGLLTDRESGGLLPKLRDLLFDANGQPLPGKKVLARTKLTLPADPAPVSLTLTPPAAPPAGDKAEPPKPAAPMPPQPAVDLTNGLAVLIYDPARPTERWIRWVEWSVVTPARYVEAEAVYLPEDERLEVRLTPQKNLPLSIFDKPIAAYWDMAGSAIPEGAAASDRTALELDGESKTLYASIKPDNLEREINLDIDGWPRAFVFKVQCDPLKGNANNQVIRGENVRGARHRVRFNSVQSAERKKRYFVPAARGKMPTAKPKEGESENLLLEGDLPPAFASPPSSPVNALEVGFEVDAPNAAFDKEQKSQTGRLILYSDKNRLRTLYADRDIHVQMKTLEPTGEMRLATTVDDFTLRIPNLPRDTVINIEARLEAANREPYTDLLPVVLDGTAPEIQSPTIGSNRERLTLKLDFPIKDRGGAGVTSVLAGIVNMQNKVAEKPDLAEPLQSGSENPVWSVQLATKELPRGAGQMYWVHVKAVDRVGIATERWFPVTLPTPLPMPVATKEMKKEEKKPEFGDIKGFVYIGDNVPYAEAEVILEGTALKTSSDSRGNFIFKNVKIRPQPYKVKVTGTPMGKLKMTEGAATPIPPGQPDDDPLLLKLQ